MKANVHKKNKNHPQQKVVDFFFTGIGLINVTLLDQVCFVGIHHDEIRSILKFFPYYIPLNTPAKQV